MPQPRATFNKDREQIVEKFAALRNKGVEMSEQLRRNKSQPFEPAPYFEVRTSALNLLARTAGENSIYYRELLGMERMNPEIMTGILTAAMTDFREGFMADSKLLVSAEVFADLLVQAEELLEHDYKDAAAVIIGAVLEDGLRRVCLSKNLCVRPKAGIDELAKELTRQNVLSAIQSREIDAKRELRNKAAHGKFGEYSREDVAAFLEFVQRLLAALI